MPIEFPRGLGNTNYEYDFFAGSQVLVYFEDVWVDDCVRIAWAVAQNRAPIYGYASQYWNAVVDGVVIVTGSIWVSFKEAGYIPIILRYLSARHTGIPTHASPAIVPQSGAEFSSSLAESSAAFGGTTTGDGPQAGLAQRADIERLVAMDAALADDAEVQAQLARYAVDMAGLSDTEFEDRAEIFEDAVWYGGNRESSGRGRAMSGNHGGGQLSDEQALAFRRADQFPPFDLLVTFGDINTEGTNHSVHRIIDTVITNTEFGGIEATGEPVFVRYDFVARNVM